MNLLFLNCSYAIKTNDAQIRELFKDKLQLNTDRIEHLNFGLTNRNYRVNADGQTYFIRMGTCHCNLLFIERDAEISFHQMAQKINLVPPLLYSDADLGIIVTPYVSGKKYGKILGQWTGDSKQVISCIIENMKRIHSYKAPPSNCTPYPLRILEHYYQIGRRLNVDFPEELIQAVAVAKSIDVPFGERVLCHHDFFWTNLLHDGKKLWVVDWEYADWDDPLYDLAGFCIKQGLTEEEREFALQEYLPSIQNEDRAKFDKMCMLFALNTSMWGFIQKKIQPDILIDIDAIAQKHLATFWLFITKMKETEMHSNAHLGLSQNHISKCLCELQ